jgi:hypothetical protein
MTDYTEPKWSEEEERFFRHEAFVAKVVSLRKPSGIEHAKPVWLQALESSAVAALITVVLGGIFGQLIITTYQDNSKKNDQALAEYRQYLERQQSIVQQAYDLIGDCTFDSQTLISLTQPKFDLKNVKENQREDVAKQKRELLNKHNAIIEKWEKEKNKMGLLISYYHYGQPDVLKAWRGAQESVDGLLDCAIGNYHDFIEDPDATKGKGDICKDKMSGVETNLGALAATIDKSRQYTWPQLSTPR